MTKEPKPRDRDATLPRTYAVKREYMRYKATSEGKTLIQYIEDKAAPQRAVNAFKKARNMQDDQHNQDSNE